MRPNLYAILPLLLCFSSCQVDREALSPFPSCPPLPTALDISRDFAQVHAVFLEPSCLGVVVSYTGGCSQQVVGLAWDGEILDGEMPTAVMEVHHRSLADTCDSLYVDTLRYDLARLQAVGAKLRILVEDPVGGSAEAVFTPR